MDYKSAGVDVLAGYESNERIKKHVNKTYSKEVLGGLGGFGAMFSIAAAKDMEEPILVSGTDGVGTKLKLAFIMDKHDTIGIDCVAMCVNDIICGGAKPLFFLDYIASSKNIPEKIEQIVKGIADGCVMAGCSLVGGETAEMPGFYGDSEYDIAGFSVGIVDKAKIIDGRNIKKGDVVIGIASSGLHSNGFSLVRKILRPSVKNVDEKIQCLGKTLGEALICPTKIYVNTILELIKKVEIKGISNITGGGFIENIPRSIPSGLKAKINKGSWDILPIFSYIKSAGALTEEVLYNTLNMGIGMVLTVSAENVDLTMVTLKELGENAYVMGTIEPDSTPTSDSIGGIEIC